MKTSSTAVGLDLTEELPPEFSVQVEPILRDHCFGCHSGEQQEGELRLDRLSSMLKGGSSAEPAIIPHQPDSSHLMKMITGQVAGKQMPPDEFLTSQQIDRLRKWIEAGASTPDNYGPPQEEIRLDHWAFRPLVRPSRPASIDSLIDGKLREQGIEPNERADRRTLSRRLSLVLHGLPPKAHMVDWPPGRSSLESWTEQVEAVLASPRFGEAFATAWLDLVRFGETDGFETNRERPTAWPYRDWVIQSFNSDLPYDQFLKEQLAGDVLGQPIGTGFLVAGPHDIVKGQDEKLGLMQRMNELDDMISVTGTAFLGLTLGCARCHNHKFDPISQRDYYALQAIFAGVRHGDATLPQTETDQNRLKSIHDRLAALNAQLMEIAKTTIRNRPAVNSLSNVEEFSPLPARWIRMTIHSTSGGEPCIDEFEIFSGGKNIAPEAFGTRVTSSGDFEHPFHRLSHINDGTFGNTNSWIASKVSGGWVEFQLADIRVIERIEWARDRLGQFGDRLPTEYVIEIAAEPNQWQVLTSSKDRAVFSETSRIQIDLDSLSPQEAQSARNLQEENDRLISERDSLLSDSKVWAGQFSQPGVTFRLYRGEPEYPREQVPPGVPTSLGSMQLDAQSSDTERRLALANWIASSENPLTARVIVNRIWQYHFGVGLVGTPSDFGQNGTPPTHPELLDWLAIELIDSGWSLKHIHRLILLSETWQRDSSPRSEAKARDSESRLLWRYPPRRLSAEGIRDSILYISGSLNDSQMGGPGFSVFEVEMENVRHYHPRTVFGPSEWRRAVYMTRVRQEKDDVFGAFDCPDFSMSVPVRTNSMTPIQSLNLLNSPFVLQQAERLAQRISTTSDQVASQVHSAWEICFQRAPTKIEIQTACEFVEQHGLEEFSRALLNSNELAFIP